jgi:hypothetical protein
MRLVLYDKNTLIIQEIHEGVYDPIIQGNDISWRGGKAGGIRDHIGHVILADTSTVKVGDTVSDAEQLECLRKIKITELSDRCRKEIFKSFTSLGGYTFSYDDHNQRNITSQALRLLSDSSAVPSTVKSSNDTILKPTRDEFMQLFKDSEAHKHMQLDKYNDLKVKALKATTPGELEIIKW